jgi:hypothetical protein
MSQRDDQSMMQTAAALANLAARIYEKLLTLPVAIGDPGFARAKSFLARAKAQNVDEAKSFNDVALHLGGKVQTKPDPVLQTTALRSLDYATDLAGALGVVASIEAASAASCTTFISALSDANALLAAATIAPIQASRIAVLAVLQRLSPDITIANGQRPDLSQIPGAVATVACPFPFFGISAKRSLTEGQVR